MEINLQPEKSWRRKQAGTKVACPLKGSLRGVFHARYKERIKNCEISMENLCGVCKRKLPPQNGIQVGCGPGEDQARRLRLSNDGRKQMLPKRVDALFVR